MRIDYTLSRNDFIKFQLFTASNSETIKKSRRRSRTRIPIIYFILGLILFISGSIVLGLVFIGIGIAWYFLYPVYLKRRYVRHFERHADEHLKNRFGKQVTLNFGDEFIDTTDYIGESKLRTSEITEINEISNYFFIKFSSGESLIIPKPVIQQNNEFTQWLLDQVEKLKINHNTDLNWKWR